MKTRIDGILLLNKSQGLTSNAALQTVKRLLNAQKAGHTGTLDPMATGMLPICFGEATKFSHYLLESHKTYEATGVLGAATTTGDQWGEVVETSPKTQCTEEELLHVLSNFVGDISQTPPMYSALKYKGKPLYHYARAGQDIFRPARPVKVFDLRLLSFDGQHFKIHAKVSKGTYIRTLIEDIGRELNSLAHMSQLHRVYTAGFEQDTMYELDELKAMSSDALYSTLLPLERAVIDLPLICLTDFEKTSLFQGKKIESTHVVPQDTLVRLQDISGFFFGVGYCQPDGQIISKRLRRVE